MRASESAEKLSPSGATPELLDVSPALQRLLDRHVESAADLLIHLTEQLPDELTTTQAALELSVSRPTLVKKVREGQIPSHKVGSHTRLKTADVASYLFQRHITELRDFVRRHVRDQP